MCLCRASLKPKASTHKSLSSGIGHSEEGDLTAEVGKAVLRVEDMCLGSAVAGCGSSSYYCCPGPIAVSVIARRIRWRYKRNYPYCPGGGNCLAAEACALRTGCGGRSSRLVTQRAADTVRVTGPRCTRCLLSNDLWHWPMSHRHLLRMLSPAVSRQGPVGNSGTTGYPENAAGSRCQTGVALRVGREVGTRNMMMPPCAWHPDARC